MKKIAFSFIFASLILTNAFSSVLVDRIVAIVNSEIITESDLKKFSKKIEQAGTIDELLLFKRSVSDLKKDRKLALDYLINEKILTSEIKRLNLSVTIERVEQEIRDIAKRNGMSRAELLNAIKAQGISVADYQDFMKDRIERQALIEQEISSKIKVSDEDVMAEYIRDFPNNKTGSYEYKISHILFNPRKGGVEAAESRADAVYGKLQNGADFTEMAEQNSEDSNYTNGGFLGSFKSEDLTGDMKSALENMDIGDISRPIKTRSGIHIFKVTEKKVISDPLFEKNKEKIRSKLFDRLFQKHFASWLDNKKDLAFVRINEL